MKLNNLNDLLNNQLEDLYDAEEQIATELFKLAQSAHSRELKKLFEKRANENGQFGKRLRDIGSEVGHKLGTNHNQCSAMRGVIQEGWKLKDSNPKPEVLDASLILTAQKAAHHQIAAYGAACSFANALGQKTAEKLLRSAIEKEVEIDKALTKLAVKTINQAAIQPAS